MKALETGRTTVTESGHTIILGWNEATTRVVVQIAQLRRGYARLNEARTCQVLYYLPVLKPVFSFFGITVLPSTSLASSDIIIMVCVYALICYACAN